MLALLEKISQSASMGLHEGKMGAALCYFKQYRITKDKAYLNKGKKLLKYVAENIGGIESCDFSNGLPGIGWGIEWLVQNKYMKADTNVVLSDVDDEIYRLVLFSKADKLNLANGTLARLLYCYKRITHRNKSGDFYRDTVLTECLILCIDELFESIVNDEGTGLNQTYLDPEFLSQVFILVNKIMPLRVDHQVVIIRNLIATRILFDLNNNNMLNEKEKYLYANSLLQAGRYTKNKIWIETADQFFIAKTTRKIVLSKHSVYVVLDKLSESTNDYSWREGWLLG
ncbi:hypothetical protein DBR43_15310 [Pedobacter sp. KBW06]|uniref:lanthionine synthetase LanC family protein n=1 Tax=Pedobacter sp. KBW06 TaxID=2153359 RepID=UPI000F5B5A9C|nr:lanthionine synthetase LanC family protein [Pedobacter sp. KBW06]RQO69447.1 hypothetical protein DBR43_15310 [Pedobacter sp. KBW06]